MFGKSQFFFSQNKKLIFDKVINIIRIACLMGVYQSIVLSSNTFILSTKCIYDLNKSNIIGAKWSVRFDCALLFSFVARINYAVRYHCYTHRIWVHQSTHKMETYQNEESLISRKTQFFLGGIQFWKNEHRTLCVFILYLNFFSSSIHWVCFSVSYSHFLRKCKQSFLQWNINLILNLS